MPNEPDVGEGLTPSARALVLGALLGALFGLSNLYVALRLGWSSGVVVTAALLGAAGLSWAARLQRNGRPPTRAELAALAAMTSAAGYSTGINLATAVAAWAMIDGRHLPTMVLVGWTALVALLGVAIAWSMRWRFVDDASLNFPSARATAEVLARLGDGATELAKSSLRPLLVAFACAGIWEAATGVIPRLWAAHGSVIAARSLPSPTWSSWHPAVAWLVDHGFVIELSAVALAGGALAGRRAAASVAGGTLACWTVLIPMLAACGVIASTDYNVAIGWALWFAVPLLVVASLVDMAAAVRPAARSVAKGQQRHPRLVGLAALAVLLWAVAAVEVPVGLAIAGIAAAFALALVCTRIAGETDVVPTGACGKLVQLGVGVAQPQALFGNLMATSIATGAAASCADATTDLRCAALLGLPLHRQAVAQVIGVLVGAATVVPAFVLLVDPAEIGTTLWPAPAAQAWRAVALSLSSGWQPAAGVPTAMVVGAVLGVLLPLAARRGPKSVRRWVPSAPAVALGVLFPPAMGWAFAFGGFAAAAWQARHRDHGPAIAFVCAGAIAGESIIAMLGRIIESAP